MSRLSTAVVRVYYLLGLALLLCLTGCDRADIGFRSGSPMDALPPWITPLISPDGRYMAFSLRDKGGGHGNAKGILLYDFSLARQAAQPE